MAELRGRPELDLFLGILPHASPTSVEADRVQFTGGKGGGSKGSLR